ncbi:hypothetical protein [Sinorhizobium meliloti]|uniref:hypothetical protein n=1 Tax=Rhizobium meliloti TaxID=382 RepID=UPI001314CEE2|nr:hypothetical protein [Sinorhizobium meliloti]
MRSEVDLVELWWEHGGADGIDFAPAQGRRNVLLALGEQLLANPGHPMAIRPLDTQSVDELLRAGVLRNVELGISVAFSHDIYEEWILERILRQRRGDIAEAIRDGCEDLQLARPLQLLATFLLERSEQGNDWAKLLAAVAEEDLRAIWSRVVLAAPVRSVRSAEMLDRIESVLIRDNAGLLRRLILAVRTNETVRDLRFLDESRFPDLTSDQREQFASEAAGPEIVSWMRLITWLVPRLDSLPTQISGELFPLLEAWVSAFPAAFARYFHVPEIAAWALQRLGKTDSSNEREDSWERRRDDKPLVPCDWTLHYATLQYRYVRCRRPVFCQPRIRSRLPRAASFRRPVLLPLLLNRHPEQEGGLIFVRLNLKTAPMAASNLV